MAWQVVAGVHDTNKHDVEYWDGSGRQFVWSGITMALAHAHIGSHWPILLDDIAGHLEWFSDKDHRTMFVPHDIN